MKDQTVDLLEHGEDKLAKAITFVEGIPAFEHLRDFVILSNEDEAPFLWLQSVDDPSLAFITVDPFLVYPDYRPDIPEADIAKLKIQSEEDVIVLVIVNIKNKTQGITVNLVSPIIVNWKAQLGAQVLLNNHDKYSVRHRIDAV